MPSAKENTVTEDAHMKLVSREQPWITVGNEKQSKKSKNHETVNDETHDATMENLSQHE